MERSGYSTMVRFYIVAALERQIWRGAAQCVIREMKIYRDEFFE